MLNVKEPVAAYSHNKEEIKQTKTTYRIKICCSRYGVILEIKKYTNLNDKGEWVNKTLYTCYRKHVANFIEHGSFYDIWTISIALHKMSPII